jgi:hypothetical protein
MRKEAGALFSAGCIAAILTIGAIGTASAAIVPFNGTDYSWLHDGPRGAEGDWITQIDDTVYVRNGDMMQFQNRWYNSYAGTADIRISYGGGFPYTCTGADEYIYYGLNYGNYYPSGTSAVPLYSTVMNCSEEPYSLVINHQYVYNGIMYGTNGQSFKWTMQFMERSRENVTEASIETSEQQDNSTAAVTPSATVPPEATGHPTPSPGFGFEMLVALACALTIVLLTGSYKRKRQT